MMGKYIISIHGNQYAYIFVDEHTGEKYVAATKRQDAESLQHAYEKYKIYLRGQTHDKIKDITIYKMRTDNGGNYISQAFKAILAKDNTRHELSPAYEHELNGTAEASVQTIKEMAMVALTSFPHTPQQFWDEFCNAAAVVSNLVPTANGRCAPLLAADPGADIDTTHLSVLGCVAMIHVPKEKRRPWTYKADMGMLCGYEHRSRVYRVWLPDDPDNPNCMHGKVVRTTCATMLTKTGYWESHRLSKLQSPTYKFQVHPDDMQIFIVTMQGFEQYDVQDKRITAPAHNQASPKNVSDDAAQNDDADDAAQDDDAEQGENHNANEQLHDDGDAPNSSSSDDDSAPDQQNTTHFQAPRQKKYPRRAQFQGIYPKVSNKCEELLKQVHTHNKFSALSEIDEEQYTCRRLSEIGHQDNDAPQYSPADMMREQAMTFKEPPSYAASQCNAKWKSAAKYWHGCMSKEYNTQKHHKSFGLRKRSSLPPGTQIGRSVWALKRKRTKSGTIKDYKGRMNYNGSQDVRGVHYDESYAASASPTTQRLQITIAGYEQLIIKQMDAEAAFTNGILDDETNKEDLTPLFMEQDPEFNEEPKYPRSQWVLQLQKAIYGTKQGARIWWQMLSRFYEEDGWTKSKHMHCMHFGIKIDDPNVYKHKQERLRGLRCASYVTDDIITAISDHPVAKQNYERFMQRFFEKFPGDDIGDVQWYTNMQITKDSEGIYDMSHKAYIEGMLEKQNVQSDETCEMPYQASEISELNRYSHTTEAHRLGAQVPMETYKSILGAIGYPATKSHPEVAAVWNVLTTYMREGIPREAHMRAATRIVKYLNYAKRYSMRMDPGDMKLSAGFDSDFATERVRRRSRGGWWLKLGNALISWKSKLQAITANSPAEAEYLALNDAVKEIKYVKLCMQEYGYGHDTPVMTEGDNTSVDKFVKTTSSDTGIRHLDVAYYYAKEQYEDKLYRLRKVPGTNYRADFLTKCRCDKKQFWVYTNDFLRGYDTTPDKTPESMTDGESDVPINMPWDTRESMNIPELDDNGKEVKVRHYQVKPTK